MKQFQILDGGILKKYLKIYSSAVYMLPNDVHLFNIQFMISISDPCVYSGTEGYR